MSEGLKKTNEVNAERSKSTSLSTFEKMFLGRVVAGAVVLLILTVVIAVSEIADAQARADQKLLGPRSAISQSIRHFEIRPDITTSCLIASAMDNAENFQLSSPPNGQNL